MVLPPQLLRPEQGLRQVWRRSWQAGFATTPLRSRKVKSRLQRSILPQSASWVFLVFWPPRAEAFW
jgi:hypothetical protein